MGRIVIAATFLGLAVGGCQVFFPSADSTSSLNGSGSDGGVCTKDPQTIKNVMLAPPMCSATNPCPCGTFCSSQTGGNCVADCIDDSWCAPGLTCSAFGQCLSASAADGGTDASTTTDPACPANGALLDSLVTNPRLCQFDDGCPFGSNCNHLTNLCHSDCRTNADCASLNTASQTFVCDCLGQCAAVGAPAVRPTATLPTLEVTPNKFTFARPNPITAPVWGGDGTRQIQVDAVAQFLNQSGATAVGPKVTVEANPGPGLMVQCPGGTAPAASSCSFSLDQSSYKAVNSVFKSAPVTLTVKPSPGAPTVTNWSLQLESTDVSNAPRSVVLSYAPVVITFPPPPNPVAITAPDPGFLGYGRIKLTTPLGAVVTLPVLARAWNGNLVFFDDTRVLSPSGKLTLKVAANVGDWETFLDSNPKGELALQGIGNGAIPDRITDYSLINDVSSATLSGSFSRSIYTEFPFAGVSPETGPPTSPFEQVTTASFALQPAVESVGFCSTDADCATGATCDIGFCTTGGPTYQIEGNQGNIGNSANFTNVIHNNMENWGGYSGGFDIPVGFVGIYAPNSSVVPFLFTADRSTGYSLAPPLPPISGEPTASLFSGSGEAFGTSGPRAIPLLTQHDGASSLTAAQLLAACVSELARAPAAPLGLGSNDPSVYDFPAQCINLGRVSVALYDQTTVQRMIEGWLTVQSFVGREGLEEANLSRALGGAGIPTGGDPSTARTISPPTLNQLSGILENGLGFILAFATDPDGGLISNHLRAPLFSNVDYRAAKMAVPCPNGGDTECNVGQFGTGVMRCDLSVTPHVCRVPLLSEQPQYQQALGVPFFALQAASAYVNVLTAYLNQVAAQTFGAPADESPSSARATALAHYGTGMRLVFFLEQWANAINGEAGVDTVNGICPGNPSDCAVIAQQFNQAVRELNAVRGRLMTAAQALHDGTNPFNIPENDVPLFFGDPTGAVSQYFAASDYLLNGWALPAVTQAQAFLDAARGAWITQSQAGVQDELNQHNRQQEVDQLMSKYGSPILANCGNLQVPDGKGGLQLLDDTQVIPYFADGTKILSNEGCYIDQTCGGSPQSLDQRSVLRSLINAQFVDSSGNLVATDGSHSLADRFVASETCKISYLRQYLSSDTFVKEINSLCPSGGGCTIQRVPNDQSLYFTNGTVHVPLAALFAPIARKDIGPGNFYSAASDGPAADSLNIYGFEDFRTDSQVITIKYATSGTPSTYKCQQLGNSGKLSQPVCTGKMGTPATPAVTNHVALVFTQDATGTCSGSIGADYPRPSGNVLPASCYKGAMGVAFHQMQSDILKIQEAKETLQNGRQNLDATQALCITEDMGIKNIMNLQNDYNEMVSEYQTMQAVSGFFEGLVSFAVGAATAEVGGIGTAVQGFDQIINTGVGLTADAVQNEATALSQMQENFGNAVQAQECWNNFLAQRGSLVTAMTNIQIAVNDLGTQQEVLANLAAQNVLSLEEGIAVLRQEQASPVSSLGHQFWMDEKVEQFRKEFEWSRRLLYLAMRAVEYEFQQSLPYRSQIVSANTPAQLQDVVIGLQAEQASRTINRRRPDQASVVLSVRDDVLAIPDNSHAPPGERNWTPSQRFQARLSDERFAYRDSKGNYLGQAIPFALAPTGILETRCGERLWTATATIQGDGIEASAPGASVLLLKRNTFSSQFCSGKAPTTDNSGAPVPAQQMQIGVIHESADLFQPGSTVDLSDANGFTAALLYPWFNIPRTQFYSTTYQNGSSQELAGRGLYGDYVLLFPKEVLSAGFALENVEDVLLRLDYLSVDNLSQ